MRIVPALLLVLASASGALAAQGPVRQALLIGIDKYPVVPQAKRHNGAANDVRMMTILLDGYGFKSKALLQADAKKEAILTALAELETSAGKDSQVVLYFSGRGSMAPAPQGGDLEPTLAPVDVLAEDPANDIRMGRIEKFAETLVGNGASVTIIVDASYRYPRAVSRGEYRHYDDEPKALNRPGAIRKQLYRGPGVFLSACGSEGSAYEWRRDFNTNSWMGAFTDELSYLAAPSESGKAPSYADVLTEVQASFQEKVSQGYMPNFKPYPTPNAMEEAAEFYRKPIFGASGGVATTGTKPPVSARPGVEKLRIGLDIDYAVTGTQREQIARSLLPTFQKGMADALKGNPDIVIMPQFGSDVDRMVFVAPSANGMSVRLQVDEVDGAIFEPISGKDVTSVMKAGLANYLERLTLIHRIFGFRKGEDAALKGGWKFEAGKPEYRVGENLVLSMSSPVAGRLYLFDRDLADGLVQLAVPSDWKMDNTLPKRDSGFGDELRTRIKPGTPLGQMRVRAMLVSAAAELPPLQAGAEGYYTNELKHLRALLKLLETGKARWAAQDFYINIVE